MIKFYSLLLTLAVLTSGTLYGQGPFSYPGTCEEPEFSLNSTPKVGGITRLDGALANNGDYVGIFNDSDELIGQGQIGTIVTGNGSSEQGFLIQLQTDAQGALNCPVFTDGDEITVKLSNAAGAILATNSTFIGVVGANGLLDGPDMDGSMADLFNFLTSSLPVTLENFTATPNTGSVDLAWATSSETDNSHFELERSANPNEGFEQIAKILGSETTELNNHYTFTDRFAVEGENFYRLKQVDFSGTFNYSPIVVATLAVGRQTELAAFPNPAETGGRLTIRLSGQWAKGATALQLFDAAGRQVAGWQEQSSGSLNTMLPVLPAGVYQLVANDGENRETARVMIR